MDPIKFTIAVIVAAVAVNRVLAWRRDRLPTRWWIAIMLMLFAAALVVDTDAVFAVNSAVTGVVWAHTLVHACGIVGTAAGVAFTAYTTGAPEAAIRRGLRVGGAALVMVGAAMAVTAAIAAAESNPHGPRVLVPDRADLPGVVAYLCVYTTALAGLAIPLAWLTVRYAHTAVRWRLRWGLRVFAAGCGLVVVYALHRIVYTLTGFGSETFSRVVVPLMIVTAALGVGLPQTVHAWARIWRRPRQRRLLASTQRLWDDLVGEFDGIALDDEAELRLAVQANWRIVEIRDGLRRLAPWMPATLDPTPAGYAHAAADALAAKHRGAPASQDPPKLDVGGSDFYAEMTFVTAIGTAYQGLADPTVTG